MNIILCRVAKILSRVILRIGVALLTFYFGLTVTQLWWNYFPISVSLCELEQRPYFYNGKIVEIRATLYSDLGGPYLYDWGCKSDYPSYPLVDFNGFIDINSELHNWLNSIGALDAPGEGLEAKVIIIGQFDRTYIGDCFSHSYRIVPIRIKQLSSFSKRR
jgi:hypothetical protein